PGAVQVGGRGAGRGGLAGTRLAGERGQGAGGDGVVDPGDGLVVAGGAEHLRHRQRPVEGQPFEPEVAAYLVGDHGGCPFRSGGGVSAGAFRARGGKEWVVPVGGGVVGVGEGRGRS